MSTTSYELCHSPLLELPTSQLWAVFVRNILNCDQDKLMLMQATCIKTQRELSNFLWSYLISIINWRVFWLISRLCFVYINSISYWKFVMLKLSNFYCSATNSLGWRSRVVQKSQTILEWIKCNFLKAAFNKLYLVYFMGGGREGGGVKKARLPVFAQ